MLIELVYGFLGAEKPPLIRHVLEHPNARERWVILVNEFNYKEIWSMILQVHARTRPQEEPSHE